MTITVNAEQREVPPGTTVSSLLEMLNLKPRNVAVELNRRLLRTEKYDTALNEGDSVEVVTFVGGG
jgi:sulfur carrier protein